MNPFARRLRDGTEVQKVAVADRLMAIRHFSADQCRAALALPDLQKVVENALRSRLRRLGETEEP